MNQEKIKIKVVLIGNSAVGKTALFQRIKSKSYTENIQPTIGGACATINVTINQQQVPIILWDTAGQDSFREIVPMYFNRASYIIIVYDITSHLSFDNVKEWADLSMEKGPENARLILVGNKVDLADQRQIHLQEAQDMQQRIKAITFMEVSAKDGYMVKELMNFIAESALQDFTLHSKTFQTENKLEEASLTSEHKKCHC